MLDKFMLDKRKSNTTETLRAPVREGELI